MNEKITKNHPQVKPTTPTNPPPPLPPPYQRGCPRKGRGVFPRPQSKVTGLVKVAIGSKVAVKVTVTAMAVAMVVVEVVVVMVMAMVMVIAMVMVK